jgi:hypothetical protein
MTTIDIETIEERIKANLIERATLQANFDAMVARFNQQAENHNKTVAEGQQRFQQLSGALAELEQLKAALLKTENNGEPALKNRLTK